MKTLTHFRKTVETGVGSAPANLFTSHPDTDCNNESKAFHTTV